VFYTGDQKNKKEGNGGGRVAKKQTRGKVKEYEKCTKGQRGGSCDRIRKNRRIRTVQKTRNYMVFTNINDKQAHLKIIKR